MWLMAAWVLVAGVLSIWLASSPLPAFMAGLTWLFLAGLVFTHWFNRGIVALFFAELILGGRGRIVEIYDVVPLRLAIGMLLIIAFFLGWFADGQATNFELRKSRACFLGGLMSAGTFLFFGLLLGRAYGNSMEYILAEARGFIFLVGSLPLLFFVTRRKADLNFMVGCFLSIVALWGAAKSFGYSLILAQVLSPKQLSTMVQEYIPQEIGAGTLSRLIPAPRLYMSGDFWLTFALPLFVSLALWTKSRRTRAILYGAIGMLFVGLVSSETRGLWLASLLGLGVVFWLSRGATKLKIALVLPALLVAVLSLSHDFLPSVQERFAASLDFTEDRSNLGRISQFAPLMDMARRHIILGNGFGSYAHDHPGVDPTEPWCYELQPAAYLMKIGIVGCGLWGLFLVWLLYDIWRTYKRTEDPARQTLAKGLLGAMLAMLFACGTNPSFATSAGMGCLLFTVVVADMLRQPVSTARRKENGISQGEGLQANVMASLRSAPSQVR
jgi:O-antigen ligase